MFILKNLFSTNTDYITYLSQSFTWRILSGVVYNLLIVMMYYIAMYYHDLQEKMLTESKLKTIVKESELNLLKSQINPHFLFNSLNSISFLTISNPAKAQEMVIKLSDYLRYSVSRHGKEFVTLKEELKNSTRYLEIEKVRFGTKLNYTMEIKQEAYQWKIPAMILQPLFENAVKHGV